MKIIQPSGSEVMGLVAAGYRLAPNGDSLKTRNAGPSSSQPFYIDDTLPCTRQKVKCFSREESKSFIVTKFSFRQGKKIEKLPVDKQWCLWLNDRNA